MFKKRVLGGGGIARLVFVCGLQVACGLQLAACSGKKNALVIFDVQTSVAVAPFAQYRFSVPENAAVPVEEITSTPDNRPDFKLGYYMPVGGSVVVLAEALTADKCVVGQGTAMASGIELGQVTGGTTPIPLSISALTTPVCPMDGGTGSGGAGVTGGGGHGGGGGTFDAGSDAASTGGAGGRPGGSGGAVDAAPGGAGGSGAGGASDASTDGPLGGCSGGCAGPLVGTGSGVCTDGACSLTCGAPTPTLCSAGSACVDTQSDDKNCGSCGHDCLGGACAAGQCQPMLIAQYQGNLQTISLGAENVYVTTDLGYIGRANKDGSDLKAFAMPAFSSSAFNGTPHVEEDGDRVFFVWYNGAIQLAYCSTSGCDSSIVPIGGPYTQYFTVDPLGHKIYWIDYSPTQLWVASTVGTFLGTPIPSATAPTIYGNHFIYSQGGLLFTTAETLERLAASGGSFKTLASGSNFSNVLAANDDTVFWPTDSGIVYTSLPNGTSGAPSMLVGAPMVGALAADNTSVYWIASGGGDSAVQTCQIANCAATRTALPSRSVDILADVAIDDHAIYWGASSPVPMDVATTGCTVWKLAK
jgi:hypothetical protein